jgi:hypothetical protein
VRDQKDREESGGHPVDCRSGPRIRRQASRR